MSIAPGTRLGPYEVVSLIGAGGMGEVYRARDSRLERHVAIKTVAPHLARDPDAIARFQREARAVAALSHPNVLAIHDVGREGDTLYTVTELLEGETLKARVARGPLPWAEAARIGAAVAEGLASAHARSIVHRDVKPANIFLTSDGRVKVVDFGLARQNVLTSQGDVETADLAATGSTRSGTVVGTVAYMSPEQVQGRPLDPRSDIFSLGCVLYELLTGHPPFRGDTLADTIAAILKDPTPTIGPSIAPAGLARAVRRCLQKDREHRFATAADLAVALSPQTWPPGEDDARNTAPVVAVLPFRTLSPDTESELFADGIIEDVIAHLAKVRSLNVISRTSVAAFKKTDLTLREIGKRLGATTILEGSVRRAGNRVRVVAQLVATDEDRHLWAETYDRDLTDIFDIQTDVALQIVGALRAELSPDERSRMSTQPTHDLEAYTLYMLGRQHAVRYTEDGFQQGLRCYERAIARDPGFALAHVGLARVYAEAVIGGNLPLVPREALARASDAVAKALALDPDLGDAHGMVGLLTMIREFDWEGAERALDRAIRLSPGSADIHDHYGWLCSSLGRSDDAIGHFRRATELDPLAHRTDLATEMLRAGRFDEALVLAERVIEIEPGLARGHSTAGWAYLLTGRHAEGLAAMERAAGVASGSTAFLGQLGQAYAYVGETDKAREVLDRLTARARERYVPPYHLAYVYTGLGEADKAIDCLERALEERAGPIYGIKRSFLFKDLRPHPRFTALLKTMNLA